MILITGTVALFSFTGAGSSTGSETVFEQGKQVIVITVKEGYAPKVITAKAGIPTILRLETKNTLDCSAALLLPQLKLRKFLPITGTTDIPLTPDQATGVLHGVCTMGMYSFNINFIQ